MQLVLADYRFGAWLLYMICNALCAIKCFLCTDEVVSRHLLGLDYRLHLRLHPFQPAWLIRYWLPHMSTVHELLRIKACQA